MDISHVNILQQLRIMLKTLKSYMMPIAMLTGIVFHNFMSQFAILIPTLVFIMLFLTYSKLNITALRISRQHVWLLLIQLVVSISLFFVLNPISPVMAQGLMIVVLAPTATAAPVIAAMLKGNVASLTTYSLLSNIMVVLVAPLFFSYIDYNQMPFFESVLEIAQKVGYMLLIPLIAALLVSRYWPKAGDYIHSKSSLSFYLWSFALIVVTARTTVFIIQQGSSHFMLEIALAIGALFFCVFQFWIGRKVGRKYNDTVAGGQGLGQKNTVLAIWMSQVYLNPLASIAPGAYVLWQNSVNSWQIWRQNKQNRKANPK